MLTAALFESLLNADLCCTSSLMYLMVCLMPLPLYLFSLAVVAQVLEKSDVNIARLVKIKYLTFAFIWIKVEELTSEETEHYPLSNF